MYKYFINNENNSVKTFLHHLKYYWTTNHSFETWYLKFEVIKILWRVHYDRKQRSGIYITKNFMVGCKKTKWAKESKYDSTMPIIIILKITFPFTFKIDIKTNAYIRVLQGEKQKRLRTSYQCGARNLQISSV